MQIKKTCWICLFSLLALSFMLFTKPTSANASDVDLKAGVKYIYVNSATSDVASLVGDAFENPNIYEVRVVYKDILTNIECPSFSDANSSLALSIRNVSRKSDIKGSNRLATAEGPPGVTISINQTVTVSNSYSCSTSVSPGLISAGVGFSVTGSKSVGISGSYTVPSTISGSKVIRGHLSAYPLYERYSFDVYSGNTHKGSGMANKYIGVSFIKYVDWV